MVKWYGKNNTVKGSGVKKIFPSAIFSSSQENYENVSQLYSAINLNLF